MLGGKTAIVTGSTSGIGLGIAKALAREGANLVLNGFGDKAQIEAAKNEVAASAQGISVDYSPADMTKRSEIEEMVRSAVKAHGAVDVLVNNAGIQHVAPIDEFPPEKWDAIIAINLTAAFDATRMVLPAMKAKKWGRIINIASAHGLIASPFKSAYVAAKHGIVGLTKTTALEVAELGITCNAICPGYVWTPLVEKQIPDQAKAHNMSKEDVIKNVFLADQPTKKFVTIEEVAELAVFLCSPGAASITGTPVSIDGGWLAH
jgi:3-hydroxybutyrate dehydrogenase